MNREGGTEMDDLFKNGLENPEGHISYHEGDWDSLEQMLDQKQKRRGIIYLMPILAGVAAAVLLVFGWWFFKPDAVTTKPMLAGVKHTSSPVHADSAVAHEAQIAVNPAPVAEDQGKAGLQPASASKQNNSPVLTRGTSGSHINSVAYNVKSNTPDLGFGSGKTDGPIPVTIDASQANTLAAMDGRFVLPGDDRHQALAGNTPVLAGKTVTRDNTPVAAPNKVKLKPIGSNKRPQFAVTVLASPDINGVNSVFSDSKVGANVGLLFSMSLSKKLSISTGALYSKKPYNTDFNNYHTTYAFKTAPEYVSADCRVLDVPINVDYQVYSKNRNSFSVGSGISSYFMLRENYHYNYAVAGTAGPTDYDISNRNKHILGVLNLQVTYQRKLNSRLNLNLEPYMKVPLTKIGYSQVKLQSTGLAVGFSWNINTKH